MSPGYRKKGHQIVNIILPTQTHENSIEATSDERIYHYIPVTQPTSGINASALKPKSCRFTRDTDFVSQTLGPIHVLSSEQSGVQMAIGENEDTYYV